MCIRWLIKWSDQSSYLFLVMDSEKETEILSLNEEE